eukprot:TRINITY_DN63937_c0_g1_i1.p1 TRINITY_DN63937_c0_g1~~TRINITY_DN63937_c0_g1_i1.p1  ORF type:complete len:645 (-),score=134.33 TRINITY_DN63937_c0_g1_i1:314-2248(-)
MAPAWPSLQRALSIATAAAAALGAHPEASCSPSTSSSSLAACPAPPLAAPASVLELEEAEADVLTLLQRARRGHGEASGDDCGPPSDKCRKDVNWAMTTGIRTHPDWYPNLTPSSSFDDFQAYLATLGRCRPPCTGPPTPAPPAPPASPAEEYARKSEGVCKPRVLRTGCTGSSYRGIAVFFHGFSACADQVDEIAPRLNAACLDVFAPVHPGHGIGVNDCKTQRCDASFGDGTKGFDLRGVPTSNGGYDRYMKAVAGVAKAEMAYRNNQLGSSANGTLKTFGLSLGAAMAHHLVTLLPGEVERSLLVSPSFGTADETVDIPLSECMERNMRGETPLSECATQLKDNIHKQPWFVASLLNVVIPGDTPGEVQAFMMELYTKLELLAPVMFMQNSWDGVCNNILYNGRKGFCAFQMRHIFAVHAYGIEALAKDPGLDPPRTQIISTARDGCSRNGLSLSLATGLGARAPGKTSMCMHPFKAGINKNNLGQYFSNEWSLPHACIGKADNPGYRWWEPKLSEDVTRYLSEGVDRLGVPGFVQDMYRCVDLPLAPSAPGQSIWLRTSVLPEANPYPLLARIEGSELWWSCSGKHMQTCLWRRYCCCDFGYSYKDGKCQVLLDGSKSAWTRSAQALPQPPATSNKSIAS